MSTLGQPHHRRSIRIKGYDYTQPGAYFVTLVTQNRDNLFGIIQNGVVQLNDLGKIVQKEWARLDRRFRNVELDEYVIMPDHVHGIIVLVDRDRGTEDYGRAGIRSDSSRDRGTGDYERADAHSDFPRARTEAFGIPVPGSIPTIIRSFKSSVTQRAQWFIGRGTGITGGGQISAAPTRIWQRNYYEHIIRGEAEWDRIRAYIRNNPLRWMEDRDNPYHR